MKRNYIDESGQEYPSTQAQGLSKPQHTPTPWKVKEYKYGKDYTGVIETMDGIYLGEMSCTMGQTKKEDQTPIANAAYIVRAVNSHDELLTIVQSVGRYTTNSTNSTNTCGSDSFNSLFSSTAIENGSLGNALSVARFAAAKAEAL